MTQFKVVNEVDAKNMKASLTLLLSFLHRHMLDVLYLTTYEILINCFCTVLCLRVFVFKL